MWLTNKKLFFQKKEENLETFQKRSPYIENSFKSLFKSAKSLNKIFWAMEYWFKALKYQILLTNTEPFFC